MFISSSLESFTNLHAFSFSSLCTWEALFHCLSGINDGEGSMRGVILFPTSEDDNDSLSVRSSSSNIRYQQRLSVQKFWATSSLFAYQYDSSGDVFRIGTLFYWRHSEQCNFEMLTLLKLIIVAVLWYFYNSPSFLSWNSINARRKSVQRIYTSSPLKAHEVTIPGNIELHHLRCNSSHDLGFCIFAWFNKWLYLYFTTDHLEIFCQVQHLRYIIRVDILTRGIRSVFYCQCNPLEE